MEWKCVKRYLQMDQCLQTPESKGGYWCNFVIFNKPAKKDMCSDMYFIHKDEFVAFKILQRSEHFFFFFYPTAWHELDKRRFVFFVSQSQLKWGRGQGNGCFQSLILNSAKFWIALGVARWNLTTTTEAKRCKTTSLGKKETKKEAFTCAIEEGTAALRVKCWARELHWLSWLLQYSPKMY